MPTSTEMQRIQGIIEKIENDSAKPKRNPRYSFKKEGDELAVEMTFWNDDSGEPLISEKLTTKTVLEILKSYARGIH